MKDLNEVEGVDRSLVKTFVFESIYGRMDKLPSLSEDDRVKVLGHISKWTECNKGSMEKTYCFKDDDMSANYLVHSTMLNIYTEDGSCPVLGLTDKDI